MQVVMFEVQNIDIKGLIQNVEFIFGLNLAGLGTYSNLYNMHNFYIIC